MITVAIIAEYNPFHLGHAYQIKKIREEFGSDTVIVAVMSGNYTQRGELAITDKHTRAAIACECGVNLVLELPFPFSMSGADFFARSAIKIIDSLGFIDYVSFGSESGDIKSLSEASALLQSEEFNKEFRSIKDKTVGYAKKCALALKSLAPSLSVELTPNNTLALEYIKALNSISSKVIPHTVKREGLGYLSQELSPSSLPSAMAIREALWNNEDNSKVFDYIPKSCLKTIEKALQLGDIPTDCERLSSALITHLRLSSAAKIDILDASDGLYNRLSTSAKSCSDIKTLLKLSETKKYTNAKIRRVAWYSFFGVTSSVMKELPAYTQLLAMDEVGKALLHSFSKNSGIPILMKPSDHRELGTTVNSQKELANRADSIFELSKPVPKPEKSALSLTPYIKE